MNQRENRPKPPTSTPPRAPSPRVLRRACACGKHSGNGGECAECRKKRLGLQRRACSTGCQPVAPPIVHDVLRSPGRPLDEGTRGFMESRFGHDFSGVRVHTDRRAAESARAVNALAYTVGNHVAFDAGQYAPGTSGGRGLLAHELTHVVQQGGAVATGPIPIAPIGGALEAAAERSAAGHGAVTRSTERQVQRAPRQATPQHAGCSGGGRNAAIETARRAAAIRCQTAAFQIKGIVTPGPGSPETAAQMRARAAVLTIFGEDLNMEQVGDIVASMGARLASPSLTFVCAPANDRECGSRAGYVVGNRSPIHLCPGFFGGTPEERVRTMVHEAAHVSGIGEASGETYCPTFDCSSTCGGFDVADSWSHLVHCLSGQTPDVPTTITAPSRRTGQRGQRP